MYAINTHRVERAGFLVDPETDTLISTGLEPVPCGCPECSDAVQPGHFACETITPSLARLEDAGLIVRAYDDGAWRWFVAS